jgi:hypothetical protein
MKISLKAALLAAFMVAFLANAGVAVAKTVKVNLTSQEIEWEYDNAGSKMQAFTFIPSLPSWRAMAKASFSL